MAKAAASSLHGCVLAGRLLPLEILPAGQFDPVYRLPISVSGVVNIQSSVPGNERFEASSSSAQAPLMRARFAGAAALSAACAVSCLCLDTAFMLAGAIKLLLEGQFDFKLTLAPAAGELPTLPLSIYGSLAMGHAPNGEDGSQSAEEWFIYKVCHQFGCGCGNVKCG